MNSTNHVEYRKSRGIDKQVNETIFMGFENSKQHGSINEKRNTEVLDEFEGFKDFFDDKKSNEVDDKANNDDSQERMRDKKRNSKWYFQLQFNTIEFSFLDVKSTHESIESQIGLSIEKFTLNEIRSKTKAYQVFKYDNDLDNFKNFGFKVIFLKSKTPKSRGIEIYLMSESIKVTFDNYTVTFAYLLFQPIILFSKEEMRKDEELMDEVKKKSSKSDMFKSLSVQRVDQEFDEIDNSIWKITDDNTENKVLIYVMHMHIYPFRIYINYSSDNLNIVNLWKGDLLNYITNLVDIRKLKIKIKDYLIKEKTSLDKAITQTIEFYLNDLINNQKHNILASVYPIRVTINILKAFTLLFKTPYQSYINQKYISVGIYQGFSQFFSKISLEFEDVGAKLLKYLSSWKSFINE